MEKRVLLAALLSAVFLAWYSQLVGQRYGTSPKATQDHLDGQRSAQPSDTQPSPSDAQAPTMQAREPSIHPLDKEDVTVIDSENLSLEVGRSSGAIRRVVLNQYMDESGTKPLELASGLHLLHLQVGERPMTWSVVSETHRSVSFQASDTDGNDYNISYALDEHNPLVDIEITRGKIVTSSADMVVTSSWSRADELGGRFNMLEAFALTEDSSGNRKYKKERPPKSPKNVPRGTILLSLGERYFCQSLRPEGVAAAVTVIPSPEGTIAAESRIPLNQLSASGSRHTMSLYIGPRDYFRLKDAGFEDAIKIGILDQIGLILLSGLSFIAKFTKNYGVAIILFSSLITCLMAPFTMISMRSMKKMSELKPQIDRIMAQHKGDAQKANQLVFALYKEHRVSPLSGCLPMLLQMPIFIAMFYAISHYVELRGQSFLWINDLSLPDRLLELPFSIPLLGSYFNLLPLIMAGAMFIQTRMSQGKMTQDQNNPAAKIFAGPIMPVLFGVMFYQFPAGLVLYWLTNTLISLIWYKVAK